ncbi:phage portal protein [Burkholderia stagnalis]|uniref:phage portal protein n=1 Tax=Burkholderia stagnalis TaxID=1503054 RepID=UPI000F57868A|nr:phage portal protein [Burkholderia stagnalis]RQQ37081.1 phage portal protein [Burkholderia stagnalis]RQQ55632.1 phage portal protein [Burkholderia stagnalis]RQY19093.1 phage portal protein [Burkholderia stagnalis]RQY64222.1 phage portal protein [Burkholderia stagnalis]RQY70409.1 phage portal protein [Burkholderia stagnalis]
MSAHAYIFYSDVPERLVESVVRHTDSITDAQLVAFDGCPYSGEITETEHGMQIEYAWPVDVAYRHALGDWFTHHGISFTVVM